MLDIEIKAHLQKLGLVLPVLMQIPAKELLEEYSHYDAAAPMFDPTGWMQTVDNARKNQAILRQLAEFQKVIGEQYPEFRD